MSKIEKVFNEILKPINNKIRKKCSNTNGEYKYNKKYSFENHIKSIDIKYNNHIKLKDEFNIPSYSQLSRLNASKSVTYFKELFDYALGLAQREIKSKFEVKCDSNRFINYKYK